MKKSIVLLLLSFFALNGVLQAQYFGRNKPRYQELDFKVHQTDHFEIYEYLNNPEKLHQLGLAAETWYQMHKAVLLDSFSKRNPLLIYNDHAGFQQTGAIGGEISVGTGGVTEGLRNRVVFPIAMTNQQTNHVLGHEMVHAFQYQMVIQGDSTNMRNLENLPLWMVEGLAEYLSIGRIDAHTALWMRDAVIHDDIPGIKDLFSYKYFPYRWGQSFWAYIAGTYGDEAIRPLFMNTAKYGLQTAVPLTLGIKTDSLSDAWNASLRNYYGKWVKKGGKEDLPGKTLLNDKNAGEMNICPVLSPNGKYAIFLSEKNLFSTDLFLADAKTGKILKKVASTLTDGHIDQFDAIESAGTWSPDSKRFAFNVYEKGRSMLVIREVFDDKKKTTGKTEKIELTGVPAFNNPAWSPDGKTVVVSGLVNGQVDLYALDLKSKKVKRLTNSPYAEILPAWNADGTKLAFSTDELSMQRGRVNGAWQMNLAVMDLASGNVEQIDLFPGADNLNPQFSKEGDLLFLSDRDGFRNLYRYEKDSKKVFQMTKLMTGITGITPYAPAFTVSEDKNRILYTHFFDGKYSIHQAKNEDFQKTEVAATDVDMIPAALPPFAPGRKDVVNQNLRLMDNIARETDQTFSMNDVRYKPKFSLEYLGGSMGVGVATGNSSFGQTAGAAGGVDMLFGDILGNHQLYAGLSLSGQLTDAAGQMSYINQKKRINWGLQLSHIPFRSGQYFQDPDIAPQIQQTLDGQSYFGYLDSLLIQRFFQERIGVFTYYPLSATRRFELGTAYEFYHQRLDRYINYLDQYGNVIGQERDRILVESGKQHLSNINAAYVGDNSHFGLTAPLLGYRYRIGVEQYFGAYRFSTLLLDGRKYFYMKPVTLAFRGMGYGRFGGNSNNLTEVYPLFVGQPYFMRGYTSQVLTRDAPQLFGEMIGSKIGVANVELRLPFTGPRELSLIKSGFLLTDINLFFDAGLAFFTGKDFERTSPYPRKPLYSTGVSLRVNLFGYIVLEPYFALPLSVPKENRSWVWGLNIVPGW